jgi:gliding motility-associated-like protein
MKSLKLLIVLLLTHFVANAENFFWVGGSGKWGDISHWVTTSGGTVHYQTIPGYNDDVYFDANSFTAAGQTVEIDISNATCKTMDWTNALPGCRISGQATLSVYGSLILGVGCRFDFTGNLYLKASNIAAKIVFNGNSFQCKTFFTGEGSQWTFPDAAIFEEKATLSAYSAGFTFNSRGTFADLSLAGVGSNYSFNHEVAVGQFYFGSPRSTAIFFDALTASFVFIGADESTVEFNGMLNAGRELKIDKGHFIYNGPLISAHLFTSKGSQKRIIELKKSIINISGSWQSDGTNLSLPDNSSTINLSSEEAEFKGGTGNHFGTVNFTTDEARVKLECTSCSFDKLESKGKLTITGKENTFGEARFLNDATIEGSNGYDKLFLQGGKQYTLEAESIQKIKGALGQNSSCTERVSVRSSKYSTLAYIETAGTDVLLNYYILRDVAGIGSAARTAANTVIISNSPGWNPLPVTGTNLYWVGGSGNWDDPAHWSFTSGGPGGACLPSPVDNVFFDANSCLLANQSINLNVEYAFCQNMDWTGINLGTSFICQNADYVLSIYGSLILSSGMDYQNQGLVHFEAQKPGNVINPAGKTFLNHVYFKGPGGEWLLQDAMSTGTTFDVYLNNGTLNTNNQALECRDFISNPDKSPRTLWLGNSSLTIHRHWTIISSNFTLNAGRSLITMTDAEPSFKAGDGLNYWNITFSQSGSTDVIEGSSCTANDMTFQGTAQMNCTSFTVTKLTCFNYALVNGLDNHFISAIFHVNALFNNNTICDECNFTSGQIYTIKVGKTLTIADKLNASAECDKFIYIRSDTTGRIATIANAGKGLAVTRCVIRDIQTNGPGTFDAVSSSLIGGSAGWTINSASGRKLFWVDGGGNWASPAHWSLQSGGAGGECVPTPVDEVIFDAKSFLKDGSLAFNCRAAFCKSIDMSALSHQVTVISVVDSTWFFVFGDISLSPKAKFRYNGIMSFEGPDGSSFHLNGATLTNPVEINSKGNYYLKSNFSSVNKVSLINGGLHTSNYKFSANFFDASPKEMGELMAVYSDFEIGTTFNLGKNLNILSAPTRILFTESGQFNNEASGVNVFPLIIFNQTGSVKLNLLTNQTTRIDSLVITEKGTVNAKGAIIKYAEFKDKAEISGTFSSNILKVSNDCEIFGNLRVKYGEFNGYTKIFRTNTFEKAVFNADAYLMEDNIFDTLIFKPDHNYLLGSVFTQTINKYFSAEGNNCQRINIKGDIEGVWAHIKKPSEAVSGYALDLRDINAGGGAKFYAGGPSQNISNNMGWIFADKPGYVYGLVNDTILSQRTDFLVATTNFNGNSLTTYQWNDGSIKPDTLLKSPSHLEVTANFASADPTLNCKISDTVNVFFAQITNCSCANKADGQIKIQSDPKWNYSFQWENGQTGSNLADLKSGVYKVLISDLVKNTSAWHKLTIGIDKGINIANSISSNTCSDRNDGRIKVVPSGGKPPYSFRWLDQPSNTTDLLTNAVSGSVYTVEVSDESGCPSEIEKFSVSGLNPYFIEAQKTSPKCFGNLDGTISLNVSGENGSYNYQWIGFPTVTSSNLTNVPAGNYDVKISDNLGCDTLLTFTVSQPEKLKAQFTNLVQPKCATSTDGSLSAQVSGGTSNYIFAWKEFPANVSGNITNLAGNKYYHLSFKDLNNCELTDSIYLAAPSAISFGTVTYSDSICYASSSGKITVPASGGTLPLTWYLDNGETSSTPVFEGVSAGFYRVSVRDKNNCLAELPNMVEIAQRPKISIMANTFDCSSLTANDGKIEIKPVVNTTFTVFDSNNKEVEKLEQLPLGIYTIKALSKNGCSEQLQVEVKFSEFISSIEVPNIFTPDKNNMNDMYKVTGKDLTQFEAMIYNRWGRLLATLRTMEEGWDGTYKGEDVPEGTYFVVIRAVGVDFKVYSINASIELIRQKK